MVKNSFISIFYQKENKGSVTKTRRLTSHLELHKKDSSSHRGLRKFLGKRQLLLAYFSKKNIGGYNELMGQLDIGEIKNR